MPNIYTTGDCLETWHRLLRLPIYLPQGTTHQAGTYRRGEWVSGAREFAETLVTQVAKVFDLVMVRISLPDDKVA